MLMYVWPPPTLERTSSLWLGFDHGSWGCENATFQQSKPTFTRCILPDWAPLSYAPFCLLRLPLAQVTNRPPEARSGM